MTGGSRATFSGPGAHLVTEVCFYSKWTVEVNNATSSTKVLWNDTLAADLDKTTAAADGIFGNPITTVVGAGLKKSIVMTVIRQSLTLRYCTAPIDSGAGTRIAVYPLDIKVSTDLGSGVIKSLGHDLDVHFSTASAPYGPYGVAGEKSNGPVLSVNWLKQIEEPDILVSP